MILMRMSKRTSKALRSGRPGAPTLCSMAPSRSAHTAVPSMLMPCDRSSENSSACVKQNFAGKHPK